MKKKTVENIFDDLIHYLIQIDVIKKHEGTCIESPRGMSGGYEWEIGSYIDQIIQRSIDEYKRTKIIPRINKKI